MVKKKTKKTWVGILETKNLRFFYRWSEHTLLEWNELSEKKATLCLILQSWVTSLSLRHWCRFWSFIFWGCQKAFHFQLSSCLLQILMLKTSSSFIFVAKNVLDCNLRLKGKSTNCTQCFHSTLRWKGKNQQNWKESSELKIAPKTKNQYSCKRGW